MIARAKPVLSTTLLALAGCAGSISSYPSLEPRTLERAPPPLASAETAAPLDPAVAAKGAALLATARGGQAAFDAAVAATCAAIGRGTGAGEGSEGWVAAQQALSAVDAARTPTSTALQDIDALVLDQARGAQDAPTPLDLTAVIDAAREIAALDAAQDARLAEMHQTGCRL